MSRVLLVMLLLLPVRATAGVEIRDDVIVTGKSVVLRAETRGRFFRVGGVLVEFRAEGSSLGHTMSGGDGMAFREFEPSRAGLYVIAAQAGDEQATGHLLVLDRGSGIVLIDVIGSLLDSMTSRRPQEGSVDSLMNISRVHYLAYVNTLGAGGDFMKSWLTEQGFPDAPLLPFDGGRVFDQIADLDITIIAVVGSARFVSGVSEKGTLLLSFESAKGARRVSNWTEIEEALLKDRP